MRANISEELMDAIEERIYLDLEIFAFTKRLHKAQQENNSSLATFFDKLISEVIIKRKETNDYLKQNGIKIFDPVNVDEMFVRYHYSQKVNGGYKEGFQQYWKSALKFKLKKRMSKYFYTGGA
jgi:tRNA(Ile)-lysidine synthase TilS/MesJ